MQTRGIPSRNRREASDEIVDEDNFKIAADQSSDQRSKRKNLRKRRDTATVEQALSVNASRNDTQRSRREVPGCVTNYNAQRQLLVGCTEPNVIEVRPQCSEESDEGNGETNGQFGEIRNKFSLPNVSVYKCHGSWTENSTVFIIARHVGSQHGVCISYRPLEGNSVRLVVGDACYRGVLPPPDHHLAANLTVRGKFSHFHFFFYLLLTNIGLQPIEKPKSTAFCNTFFHMQLFCKFFATSLADFAPNFADISTTKV